MYDQLNFQDINMDRTIDYDELVDLAATKYQYNSHIVDLNQIGITDDGVLSFGKNEGLMTKEAFIKFCKHLRIPDPFAKFIPWDLLKYNIDTLTNTINKGVQVFTRSDGTIVNVARDVFTPIPHATFIETIRDKAPEVRRGVISDNNMEIDVTQPVFGEDQVFQNIEPEVGDITETGLKFNNSTSGHNFTSAQLFLLRLVCTNGMTLPTKLGYAKMRTKPGRDLDISINNFLRHLGDMAVVAGTIQQRMIAMNANLLADEFSQYWKGLDKIVKDPDLLEDEIFQVDHENRLLYRANERANKKHPAETPLIETNVNGYRLLNNVTAQAKSFNQGERIKLEAYAGKMLMGDDNLFVGEA